MLNRQIDCFLATARAGSFSAAAKKLYTSTSAVISQVEQLERDLGCRLFIRTHADVALTEEGFSFLDDVETIDRAYERLIRRTRFRASQSPLPQDAPSITVGVFGQSDSYLICPATRQAFESAYPGSRVRYMRTSQQIVQQDLLDYKIDVCFVQKRHLGGPDPDGPTYRTVVRDFAICSIPAGHRLASSETVSLGDLHGERLLFRANATSSEFHDRLLRHIDKEEPDVDVCYLPDDPILSDLAIKDIGDSFIGICASLCAPNDEGVVLRPFVDEDFGDSSIEIGMLSRCEENTAVNRYLGTACRVLGPLVDRRRSELMP